MLHKTKGIVLHALEYSETSLIVKIYTEDLGLQSYLIRSARKKKSKTKAGIFQPLSLLEFVAYYSKRSKLQTLKEITSCFQFKGIPYDIKKSSIAFFIAEVLYKTIREEEQNKPLFEFIFNSVQSLDEKEGRISEFHIFFLLDLSKYLGFYPHNNYNEKNNIFNLYDGRFQEHQPEHSYFTEKRLSKYFHELIEINKRENVVITSNLRKELINKLLDYYRIHINGFNTISSHIVLEDVFN
jgi:DNA repair protein RecO (recombination protein O)